MGFFWGPVPKPPLYRRPQFPHPSVSGPREPHLAMGIQYSLSREFSSNLITCSVLREKTLSKRGRGTIRISKVLVATESSSRHSPPSSWKTRKTIDPTPLRIHLKRIRYPSTLETIHPAIICKFMRPVSKIVQGSSNPQSLRTSRIILETVRGTFKPIATPSSQPRAQT